MSETYREYLRSPAWFARRKRWINEEIKKNGSIRCRVLGTVIDPRKVELHHVDYSGVQRLSDGKWRAGESHDDLWPMSPAGHESVHRMLDQDRGLGNLINRTEATLAAIRLVRIRFAYAIITDGVDE